ncbi:type I-F CRISPR-associated protein Csy2 [Pasteurella canis]|uniref:type I-F CRISPR-associated protein Csy2 n=1 Tax=Pasteurella canis TaxID=753 RepID=UPI000669214F|nr:type I-F CRISPR-associated protein Csy2 [Pasteurella canis]MXN88953.1 type I-F CRISPR-associated protein Csy2 [Pasteurella canis]
MFSTDYYILFDRIKIQGANTISGPLSYGFPALTGVLGAIHALSRKLSYRNIQLGGVMVACHNYELQAYKGHKYDDFKFTLNRHPMHKKEGEWKVPPIIEEGKIHLDLSLIVELHIPDNSFYYALEDKKSQVCQDFLQECKNQLWTQRIAGGSVLNIGNVDLFGVDEDRDIPFALMPAFVLMDAKQDLINITEELQTSLQTNENGEEITWLRADTGINSPVTELDALLEVASLHYLSDDSSEIEKYRKIYSVKQGRGWLVPIPVGYQAISPLLEPGQLKHCRTMQYPSQYVEAIYSLGKWVFPLDLPENLSKCFWHYTPPENNFYLISQGEES